MKGSKKLLSLLLALLMTVSLLSGALAVGAAEEVTVTPDATVGGETVTMTATGVQESFTKFDIGSLMGMPGALGYTYALWFDGDGAFSFDRDVTLTHQYFDTAFNSLGTDEVLIPAGEVKSIADGVYSEVYGQVVSWSEFAVTLDDGNSWMIVDSTDPGNYANTPADTPLSEFPGSVNGEPSHVQAPVKPDYPDPEGVVRTANKNDDGSVTLAFSSDIHYNGVNMNLADWIEASGVDYIDAMGFCGDLGSGGAANAADYWTWVGEVMAYTDSLVAQGKVGSVVYTHGNHEWFPTGGGNFKNEFMNYPDVTGNIKQLGEAVRTEAYIIYCFGAGDGASTYACHFNPDDIAVMAEYLSTAPTDIPIFILTHYPLHTWTRDTSQRVINYAGDVIDVLNEHPNVVLLWGHNHTEYDDNYYEPKFAGDEVVIDAAGTVKTLNFTYMAAGCTSDFEYTNATGGSASVMNKGLIVTINADGSLNFDYITLDGRVMHIAGPWLVRFRDTMNNVNEAFAYQYVEDGGHAAEPLPPEFEGYRFIGWYTWLDGAEVLFDFAAPITRNTLVTAKYARILTPVAEPDTAIAVTPDAAYNGESLTMTAAGVGDLITVFDLASIGYGTGIEYGFWFDPDGVVSFSQDVTLYYQGSATDFTLKAGEFYSMAGFGEHYLTLDDGNMLLLLEKEAPGNFAGLPGDRDYSAFPGAVAPSIECMVSNQAVTLDGEAVEIAHYNVNGNNYFKLRDLACILSGSAFSYDVGYDVASRTVSITTGAAYAPLDTDLVVGADASDSCVRSNQPVMVDGETVTILAFNIGGDNYVQLRDLAEYIGYGVGYNEDTRTVLITTK